MSAVSLPERKIPSSAKKPIGVRLTPLYLRVVGPVVSLWARADMGATAIPIAMLAMIPRMRVKDMSGLNKGKEETLTRTGLKQGARHANVDQPDHGIDISELRSCNDAGFSRAAHCDAAVTYGLPLLQGYGNDAAVVARAEFCIRLLRLVEAHLFNSARADAL